MNGRLIGGVMIVGGVVLGIATIHLVTILAVLLVAAGAGTYKVSSTSRRAVGGSTIKTLLR